MRQFLLLCASAVIFANARHLKKRNNQYGDEPVTVAGSTVDTEPFVTQAEYEIASVGQQTPAGGYAPELQPSGYRKKRNNQYGDEPTAEGVVTAVSAEPTVSQAEEEVVSVEQHTPAGGYAADVQPSGYRKKRNNQYGDEPTAVTIGTPANAEPPVTQAEYETVSLEQKPPSDGYAPALQASGYRKKRNNQYGDEPMEMEIQNKTVELTTPAEESFITIGQTAVMESAPSVEASGY